MRGSCGAANRAVIEIRAWRFVGGMSNSKGLIEHAAQNTGAGMECGMLAAPEVSTWKISPARVWGGGVTIMYRPAGGQQSAPSKLFRGVLLRRRPPAGVQGRGKCRALIPVSKGLRG